MDLIKKKVNMLRDVLAKKFVYIDDVAKVLEIGNSTSKNVFLYGRGGHAKSEIAQEFLKYVDPTGENSFIQACGEGLTEEKLFGGMNLKKFQETGEIEYLVESSFMNKEYVVFEELLDSRMSVLLSLKDILTSKKFRQGKQQFDIKTRFVICLTNRTKQEVSSDDSIKALLERFPIEQKVEWDKYDSSSYNCMFIKVLGTNNFKNIADICHAINESGNFISPRTAIHMAEVYDKSKSINDLRYFGLSSDVIDTMEKKQMEVDQIKELELQDSRYNTIVGNIDRSNLNSIKLSRKKLNEILSLINCKIYCDGNAFSYYANLKDKINVHLNQLRNDMIQLLDNE